MRAIYLTISLSLIVAFSFCIRNDKVKNTCILDFKYEKHDAVGPEGLVSIIRVDDRSLRDIFLSSDRLVFKYSGGIYEVDSLYFPSPMVNIYNTKDSTLVFGQGVFGLRQYPELFIDSIIQKTKKELVIEIIDSLNNKKWTIARCK
ncbi:MAG: hypothetical protein ABFC55_06220 [Tenuifilaceae bacterium]